MAMDDDSKGEPDSPGSDDSGMEHLQPPLRGESHPRLPQHQQPYRMDRSRVNPRMPSLAILPMRARRGASFPAVPLPSGRPSSRIVPANWTRAQDADELDEARAASASSSAAPSAVAPVPSLADQERFQVSLEIERRFRALLATRLGFQIVPQAEDGNCMFRSVAHQVYGDPEQHLMVRAACMKYMSVEREFFREFIAGETFEAYIDRMKCDGEWGDNVELQAMSEIYERPIEIYAYSDKPLKTFMSAASSASAAAAAAGAGAGAGSAASSAASSSSSVPARLPSLPIRLSYHFASHYNSVIHPVQHQMSYRAQPPPGTMEQEALARVARMRLMMAEQQRAAQAAAAAAAASSSAAGSSSAASSSSSALPGSLASSRSAFSSFQSGLASNPSGFDQAVAASLGELDAAFESEVSQAQQQSLEQREREEAQMLDAACQQSERDDLDAAIAEATRQATSAAAAQQPQQPNSASSAAASSSASAAAAASASASPPAAGAKKPSVEEEVYQRALAASLAAAPLQPSEEEQLAQAMRMSVAAAAGADAASPSSASAAAAAADSGLQSALRASMGESAQLPRSVQACMEFGFTLEAAVQAYDLCNTPQAQQAGVSADAAHDLLVQRMMDYLCTS